MNPLMFQPTNNALNSSVSNEVFVQVSLDFQVYFYGTFAFLGTDFYFVFAFICLCRRTCHI